LRYNNIEAFCFYGWNIAENQFHPTLTLSNSIIYSK